MEKRTVGPFELEKQLGVGGMGVVYLGTYTKDGKSSKVAVKVLSPELNADKRLLKRFVREMAILKKLKHRNIVKYYGGGHDGTQHYYAMEFIDGGSLDHVLRKKKKLSWEQAIEVGKQVAKALEHAHNHGIVHRDLKPANLFLSKEGKLKLGDFGIARDTQATALTAAGRTVGTYAYMAPEQISGKPPVSRKTDLYALGCVLYEVLTGRTPFVEENPAQMLFAHLELEPPRVTSLAMDCPIWLETVVMRLLEKDPEDRYYDALAVQVALDEVGTKVAEQLSISKQTATSTVSGASSTVTDRQDRSELVKILTGGKKKKKKRKKGPFWEQIWFLAACLLLLLGGVGWAMWPLSDEEKFARAEQLMQNPDFWGEARTRYLDDLVANPDGEYASQAQDYIDQIEMDRADRQAMNTRRNPENRPEGERLYIRARKFEDMPDRISALRTYRSMVDLLGSTEEGPSPENRPFLNLARKKIAEIEASSDQPKQTTEVVNDAIRRADEAATAGNPVRAEEIWSSIITLYQDNSELEPQLKYVRARLRNEKVEPIDFSKPPTASPPANDSASENSADRQNGDPAAAEPVQTDSASETKNESPTSPADDSSREP
ncbi:MAG: serine/threonine protein kinase [Planctomycetaceae bacterium]